MKSTAFAYLKSKGEERRVCMQLKINGAVYQGHIRNKE